MAIVTNQTEFKNALTARAPEIILGNDITLTTYSSVSYTVTIKGETPGLSLFWGNPTISSPDMLIVTSAGVLTLESIILDAQNRDGTLVQVNGGTLIMNDGAIIRNVKGNTAQNGVSVGSISSNTGGTFIMNGGLITGIDSADALFCGGGSVIMNNDAAVSENNATGVTIATSSSAGSPRASFTMTGNSRITGNRSKQPAGGVILYGSDMFMGINEGDAPEISGNNPPSGSFAGGLVASDGSALYMRHNAKIHGNYSDLAGGGILAQNTIITMRDNAAITGNTCEGSYGGGGARIHQEAKLTLFDNAHISNNTCIAEGGGVYLQPGGILEMTGDSYIDGNTGTYGGGIYIGPPVSSVPLPTKAVIGTNDSAPAVFENTATEHGGGIFIGKESMLELMGNASIHDNTAVHGAGICKEGILHLSQSPKILDGLFFEASEQPGALRTDINYGNLEINAQISPEGSQVILQAVRRGGLMETVRKIPQATADGQPVYTANVPVIDGTLTERSEISVEISEYISPENVPLVLADKGGNYEALTETDRAAWKIPQIFSPDCHTVLNSTLTQVLIIFELYGINYYHMFDASNPNPDSYDAGSEFPIVLQEPGMRQNYDFAGFYNEDGMAVTEISEDSREDLTFTARWKEK